MIFLIGILSAAGTLIFAGIGLVLNDWFWFGPGGVFLIGFLGVLANSYIKISNDNDC